MYENENEIEAVTETLEEEVARLLEGRCFSSLRLRLSEEKSADIAELIAGLSEEERLPVYRLLSKDAAAEVLVELDADAQRELIEAFSDWELREVLSQLYSDDTAALTEEMPDNFVRRILNNCPPELRHSVNQLLQYPEGSAGSMMTTEYVRLKAEMTVGDAFAHIRRVAIDKETVYNCYVTDADKRLLGIVSVRAMLLCEPSALIGDIMEENIVSVNTHEEREQVARLFDKYGYLALPVVDKDEHIVGIITVDDALEVIGEETEEDFSKMAAITPTPDIPYLRLSPFTLFRSRIPWLLLLMLGATFTGLIIASFESALAASVVLTAFIPMIMGTGGNSGSQASVTVIRGLSLGEIERGDAIKVFWKELRVSVLCGVCLAVFNYGKMLLIDGLLMQNPDVTPLVSLTVSLTLCVTVVCAKLIGAALPILAKRLRLDPAVMASPFITTAVDAISLLVYFAIAKSLLHLP